ncbi:MAG: sulfurtransferase [Deltaproteobacteria bacterium]|nr:sulfurtransferase [Deltaproteobacteria bacterium]
MVTEIGPKEFRSRLASGETPVVLDVREPEEIRRAPFAGALEIPMGEVPGRLDELDPTEEIVVLCHHGIRSRRIAAFLETQGFQRVSNLAGGIDSWSAEVDPGIPRY